MIFQALNNNLLFEVTSLVCAHSNFQRLFMFVLYVTQEAMLSLSQKLACSRSLAQCLTPCRPSPPRSSVLASCCRSLTTMKTSSLYIRGKEARNRRALVLPHLEIDKIVNDIPTIQKTLEARNIQLDISLLNTKLPSLRIVKNELKRVQMEIMQLSRNLSDDWKDESQAATGKTDSEMKSELQTHYITEREVKQSLYVKEEEIVPMILQIPNFIRTPTDAVTSLSVEYGTKPKFAFHPESHVDIGGTDLVFRDHPRLCYLKGKLAQLELALCNYFSERMKDVQLEPISGSDWVVDTVVEGCGTNPNNLDHTLAIESKEHSGGHHLHLVGGSSLESFAAYFTRRQVRTIPASYCTLGRFYRSHCDALLPGLFSLTQSTRASVFSACNQEQLEPAFEALLTQIRQWYEELQLPFRMVLVEPPQLGFIESLRVSIEVWSPAQDSFVPCGFLTMHDDFISRRLIMARGTKASDAEFTHTLYGCVADIHCLIACFMENGQKKDKTFDVPAIVQCF